jgi:hypothetical protein
MTLPGFGDQAPPVMDTFNYTSGSGTFKVASLFFDGKLGMLEITPKTSPQSDYIYSGSPPTDTINQANKILQRFQTFVSQEYAIDSSYIASMESVLKNAVAETPKNVTVGNIQFQIIQNGANYDLKWICFEHNISMGNWKRIEMRFNNNFLVNFQDTWSIYQVGGPNVLSTDEASNIALAAARNYTGVKHPQVFNSRYDVSLAWVPYRDNSLNLPSKIPRSVLTLYPLWYFQFYFNSSVGIQVGVWGDTGEVAYCNAFGYFQAFRPSASPTMPPITIENATTTTIPATTDNDTIVTLTLNGNITASQITNAAITSNQSEGTTTISFNVTGASGDIGFSNITIPKSLVPDGSTPIVQIDSQITPNQGWTQDQNNYYVWYMTHFSAHKVTIAFSATPQTENLMFSWWIAVPLVAVLALIALGFVATIARRRR